MKFSIVVLHISYHYAFVLYFKTKWRLSPKVEGSGANILIHINALKSIKSKTNDVSKIMNTRKQKKNKQKKPKKKKTKQEGNKWND